MQRLIVASLTVVFLLANAAQGELLTWLAGDVANAADSNVLLDSSKHGNHALTVQNVSLTPDGKRGGGIDFGDGAASFVKMNASTWNRFDGIVENQEFTIAFWLAAEESAADPRNQSVFWFQSPSNGGGGRGIQSHLPFSNGQVYLDVGGCCNSMRQRVNGPQDRALWDSAEGEEWTHWAYTMDFEGNVAVYADGVEVLLRDGPTVAIGDFSQVWWGGAISGANSFAGRMDDIVIADNWVGADDIAKLMNDGPAAVWADDILNDNLPTNVLPNAEPVAEQFHVGGVGVGEYLLSAESISLVRGPSPADAYKQGLAQEWSKSGNLGNKIDIEIARLNSKVDPPAFRAGESDWWSGSQTYGDLAKYPVELKDAGFAVEGNNDGYSVRLTGEILFEADGTYRFRDGIDDYAYFAIDLDRSGTAGDDPSEIVVNDNAWANADGVRGGTAGNNPSPLVEVEIEVEGEQGDWIPIEVLIAEGVASDAATLFWNGNDLENELIADVNAVIDDPSLLVPQTHTRSKLPGVVEGLQQFAAIGNDGRVYTMQVSSDLLDSDHIAFFGGTLDVTGTIINVEASGELIAGDSWALIIGDDIVGMDSVTYNFANPEAWDLSHVGTTGRIIYTGPASEAPVPEPSSLALIGLGGLLLGLARRGRR